MAAARRRSSVSPRLDIVVIVVVFFFLLSLSPPPAAVASPPGFFSSVPFFGRGSDGGDDRKGNAESSTPDRRRSNLLKVDPSNILSIMTKRGGLVLPKSVRDDLRILEKVCRCKSAYLDVLNREMEVRNFTVSLPGGEDDDEVALSVGRFYVKWDSYAKPCVEVEVDDVGILVEFVNLILTRNNWNELKDAGFPPALIIAPDGATPPPSKSGASTFVRVGSVDLSGNVVLRVRSRPLDGQSVVPDVILDLDALDELNSLIRSKSSEKRKDAGERKGCTTDELYDIVRSYFGGKIKSLLRAAAVDLAGTVVDPDHRESDTIREARRVASGVASGAKYAFGRYASGARGATEERIQREVAQRLARWGVGEEEAEAMKREVTRFAAEAAALSQVPEGGAEGGANEEYRN